MFRHSPRISTNHFSSQFALKILTSVLLLLHCSCDSLVGQSKNIFVTNLGWVCHLLRWLLSNVYTRISDWQEAVVIINQTIPSFINLVFNENQTSCTFSINLGISDKTKEIDPSQRYNVSDQRNYPAYLAYSKIAIPTVRF